VRSVSRWLTRSVSCEMMGPASSSSVTKWLVAPITLTPAWYACRYGLAPLKEGSSPWWMLMTDGGGWCGARLRQNAALKTRALACRFQRRTVAAVLAQEAAGEHLHVARQHQEVGAVHERQDCRLVAAHVARAGVASSWHEV
jgi:hypothetical protein